MRHIIALPDYDQSGSISAWTEQGTKPLKQALSEAGIELTILPPSFIIGIPEPIIKEKSDDYFVISQVVRLNHLVIISTSCQAGLDKTGRHVFLTELFVENNISNAIIEIRKIDKYEPKGLNDTLTNLIIKMRKHASEDIEKLIEISENNNQYRHLSSHIMVGMHYQPDWPKKKLSDGILVKKYLIFFMATLALAAVVFEFFLKNS